MQSLSNDRQHNDLIRVLLVSPDRAVYTTVLGALSQLRVTVDWERTVEPAASSLRREGCSVLLVTADCNWRSVLQKFGATPDPPLVVVLTGALDPHTWARALLAGAFDVLPVDLSGGQVKNTVLTAHERWRRRQSTRAAVAHNPMSHSSPAH